MKSNLLDTIAGGGVTGKGGAFSSCGNGSKFIVCIGGPRSDAIIPKKKKKDNLITQQRHKITILK